MSWFEMKEQRRKNRGERGSAQRTAFQEGHRRRKGLSSLVEKKSGEVLVQAKNGCFGRLAEFDKDLYEEWARGTRGERTYVPYEA